MLKPKTAEKYSFQKLISVLKNSFGISVLIFFGSIEDGAHFQQKYLYIFIFSHYNVRYILGKGLPVYTFKNLCEQDTGIALEDGTLKMVVVPKEWKKVKSTEVQSVLRYIYDNVPTDNYTKELDMHVADIKYDEVISNESLSYFFKMQDMRDEGIKEGMEKGRLEERFNMARIMKDEDCPMPLIIKTTGLSKEDIERL